MRDNAIIVLGVLSGLLGFILVFSLQFNLMQAVEINEYKGKEKVYRMQIHHYNPNDYTLQMEETRPR